MDFDHLLEKGYIRPAMRNDIEGFQELREEHKRPVPAPNLPPRIYSERLDELSPEKYRERYSRKKIESCFKSRLVKIFSSEDPLQKSQIIP